MKSLRNNINGDSSVIKKEELKELKRKRSSGIEINEVEDIYDFTNSSMDNIDDIIDSFDIKKEIISESLLNIKKEEKDQKTKEFTKTPILSLNESKNEIITFEESNIKKENKVEINRTETSPSKKTKIKNNYESSKINSLKQQEWINIHQTVLKNSNNHISSYNQKIEFEENNGEHFLFYWIDAMENMGTVYLLGKVYDKRNKRFISCCVTVNNIMRNLFILPRNYLLDENGKETEQKVEIIDVLNEMENIRKKYGISSWKVKSVKRKYAFEEQNVPPETYYLKTVYSFKDKQLPSDIYGKTFSRIFGTNTSALELLIIKRKLMGPCWIRITNYSKSQRMISWCKTEVVVSSPKSINVCNKNDPEIIKEIPPFVIMSLNIKTVLNSKSNVNEIVIASAMIYPEVNIMDYTTNPRQEHDKFTILRKLPDIPFPIGFKELLVSHNKKVELVQNEIALLNYLMAIIQKRDPDIIVGHNFIDFHLDVLLHRMKSLGIVNWSRIGRLRRTIWPNLQLGAGGMGESSIAEKNVTCGRLLCDTFYGAKEYLKSPNNSLTYLSKLLLNIKREEIEPEKILKYFLTKKQLIHLIQHTEFDSFLSSAIMFKIQLLPLTNQLTGFSGNLWSKTLCGSLVDRNEFLLLHAFHGRKFICPDKYDYKKRQNNNWNKKKTTLSGGLVLEPKKGFYDKYILILDFNSLYPSIIQEYNICFTTVNCKDYNEDNEENNKLPEIPDQFIEVGILPKLLKMLVQRRKQVKSIIKTCKDPTELISLDIRQKALKLTANSLYGYLGYNLSRFYAKPIAMLVTSKGREILQNTVDLAKERSYDVIYGDTDSIMINTNTDDLSKVKNIGNEIKRAVNEKYKLLEIEIEGYYRKMLLLRKKNYAALIEEELNGKTEKIIEKKGAEVVRRDWCSLSINASDYILNQLFSDENRENSIEKIYNYLRKLSENIRTNQYTTEDYIINKNLSKNPEDYSDWKIQPHVLVALRLKARGVGCHPGDTIQYVICKDDQKKNLSEKAYHPDEIKMNNELKIDYEWYLNEQILPLTLSLCEPIEEINNNELSKSLGLNSSKYIYYQSNTFYSSNLEPTTFTFDSNIPREQKFKNVEKWNPICCHCNQKSEFVGIFREKDGNSQSGLKCPNCNKMMPYGSLAAQLHHTIRNHVKRCNDVLNCDNIHTHTKQINVNNRKYINQSCDGNKTHQAPTKNLFIQLEYYSYLFNVKETKKSIEKEELAVFSSLSNIVNRYIEKITREYVDQKSIT